MRALAERREHLVFILWGSYAQKKGAFIDCARHCVIYGALYLREGLFAAIVAHATTNLVLGLWVLKPGQWQFW